MRVLLEELFNYVQGCLIEKRNHWVKRNFMLVLNAVIKLTNCKKNYKIVVLNWSVIKKILKLWRKRWVNSFPLVRFIEISSDVFFNKVHPYKAVIPIHIYEELEEFYYKGTLPKTISMGPRVSSTIIKSSLVSIIANWIDRNDLNVLSFNIKYKFNLIYLKSLIVRHFIISVIQ